MEANNERTVIVVGGGPSGCSAAIQLARSGLDVLLITKEIGGLVKNANLIENLLGFPKGISGEQYKIKMQEHLMVHNVETVIDEVKKIKQRKDKLVVETKSCTHTAKYVVVGTGTIPRTLNIEGEHEAYENKKLFYEIFEAKRYLKKAHEVIIIGGGDAAYDYSLNIANNVKNVHILQRSKKSRSLAALTEKVKKVPNIEIHHGIKPIKIKSNADKILLTCERDSKAKWELRADMLIVAIGRDPNIGFIDKQVIDKVNIKSKHSNLYLVGDVQNRIYRQIAIALGDALRTAMEIVQREVQQWK